MKSGLEGRNNLMVVSKPVRKRGAAMKSGLEGRNNDTERAAQMIAYRMPQ